MYCQQIFGKEVWPYGLGRLVVPTFGLKVDRARICFGIVLIV